MGSGRPQNVDAFGNWPASATPISDGVAQDHDLNMWRAYGVFLQGWATAASGAPGDGLEFDKMNRFQDLLRRVDPALAEASAPGGDALKIADLA